MFIHTIVDSMNTCLICDSPFEKSVQCSFYSDTEIAPPQMFLFVNRSPIQYDFRGDIKAMRYCVNIALILNKFCQETTSVVFTSKIILLSTFSVMEVTA